MSINSHPPRDKDGSNRAPACSGEKKPGPRSEESFSISSRGPVRAVLFYLLCALLVLACLFFLYGHRWLSGHTIFRGVVQEQYYLLGQYAFDHQILRDFRHGLFPLWNPLNALGTPLLGNMLSAVFYPLKVLIYLFPSDAGRDAYIVLRILIAALFTFALARALGLRVAGALLASLAFSLSGYMKMFVNENYLNADVLLPGLVLLVVRGGRNPRKRDLVFLSLLVFSVLNNGHPEAAFYALLFPAWIALAGRSGFARRNAFSLFFFSSCLGFLFSLPLLFPFLEYWFRGYHFHVPGTGFFHYSAKSVSSLFSPWFFGQAAPGAPFLARPEFSWPESVPFLPSYGATTVPWLAPSFSAAPLFLALVGASLVPRLSRIEVAMAGYALFFLAVMFGLPLFRLIGHVPPFSFSGNFKHPAVAVALTAAVFAGRGLDAALYVRIPPLRAVNITLGLLVALLALGFLPRPFPVSADYLNPWSLTCILLFLLTAGILAVHVFWAEGFHRPGGGKSNSSGRVEGRGESEETERREQTALGRGEMEAEKKARARGAALVRALVAAAVFMGAAASLVVDGFQHPMREVDYERRIQAGKGLEILRALAPLGRVYLSQELSPPNLNIVFGFADIRVMDGVNDRRFVNAINKVNGHNRVQAGNYWYRETGYLQPMPDKLGHPLLRLFNVQYALMSAPLPYNRTVGQVLESAEVHAAGPGYVGKARFPVAGGFVDGLFQHPPSRISWGLEAPGDSGRLLIGFYPSIMKEATAREKDGVWFGVFGDEPQSLLYARYLHPGGQEADSPPPRVLFRLPSVPEERLPLTLITLPHNSLDFDHAGWADLRAGPRTVFSTGSWEELARGETWLYRDLEALPRVFLVSRSRKVSEAEALELLASAEVNPREEVIISGLERESDKPSEGSPAGERAGLPGIIEEIDYSSQRVSIRASLWREGFLVVSDLFYPGWRAWVDGQEARILRADYCLRGLKLSRGRHRLEIVYQPISFRLGLDGFIAGLLAGVGFILKRNRRGSASSQ